MREREGEERERGEGGNRMPLGVACNVLLILLLINNCGRGFYMC